MVYDGRKEQGRGEGKATREGNKDRNEERRMKNDMRVI